MCALLSSGSLPPRALRVLVLDEADSLLGEGFYADVAWVHGQLPTKKQARRRVRCAPCCHPLALGL